MRASAKKAFFLVGVATVLGIVNSSNADSVNFSTFAQLSGPDQLSFNNFVASATDSVTGIRSSSTLSFTPVGPLATPVQSFPNTLVKLGTFTLTYAYDSDLFGDAPPPDIFANNNKLSLLINQSEPGGSAVSSAFIQGEVFPNSGGPTFFFSPDPVVIAGENYFIDPVEMPFIKVNSPNSNGGSVTVTADLNAVLSGPPTPPPVPLPASVSMGLGLFGVMGVLNAVRRRVAAV